MASHAQKHLIRLFVAGGPLPAKVLESGSGYTLSGKALDTSSASFHAYAGKAIRMGLVPGVEPVSKKARALPRGSCSGGDSGVAPSVAAPPLAGAASIAAGETSDAAAAVAKAAGMATGDAGNEAVSSAGVGLGAVVPEGVALAASASPAPPLPLEAAAESDSERTCMSTGLEQASVAVVAADVPVVDGHPDAVGIPQPATMPSTSTSGTAAAGTVGTASAAAALAGPDKHPKAPRRPKAAVDLDDHGRTEYSRQR